MAENCAHARPLTGRSVHPRSVLNATTARQLLAHLATTLVLATVALLAAWQFMFSGVTPHHGTVASHRTTASTH
ncbi:hypothetical protein [Mycolicibacterium gadium]|uniref:hypothetical protein n=1 Tax=Mycolicibacterium gadium TaxID=1794 RepID=UPI0013D4D930|nr:hypothetical protein [Mycolicibacterium gadium]